MVRGDPVHQGGEDVKLGADVRKAYSKRPGEKAAFFLPEKR